MIFGESGGGAKTSCLYVMPAAAPYFNKASIESGPDVRMLTREIAAETTALVLQALNIAPNEWRKLLDVPAAELLCIQSHFPPLPPHQRRKIAGSAEAPIHGFGPVAVGAPEWSAYTIEDRSSLRIGTRCEVMHNRFGKELAMCRSIGRLA